MVNSLLVNYEADYSPQFSFGDGLSYTTFKVSDLKLEQSSIKKNEELKLEVTVTNTGERAGKEVVEIYTSDLYATEITPDVKRLRRFKKVDLKPGESKTLHFTIPAKDLAYFNTEGKPVIEAGEFEIMVKDLKQKLEIE